MANASQNQENTAADENIEEVSDTQETLAEDSRQVVAEDIDAIQDALDEAKTQAAENWDKFMRSQAELDNIMKRTKRDLENAHRYALEKFVNELLPVRDSLEMGLDHAEGEDVDPDKLKEGSELTLKMLAQVMEKFNIVQLDPRGEAFNPELHEAMAMVPSDEVAPNNVLDVIQRGYQLNERLIRPARVVVAKALDE